MVKKDSYLWINNANFTGPENADWIMKYGCKEVARVNDEDHICTLDAGHPAFHVAQGNGHKVFAVWIDAL